MHLKKNTILPDERYNIGPFLIERYGKSIRLVNRMTNDQHGSSLAKMADYHLKVLEDLRNIIPEIRASIAEYDPLVLLHRAAYEVFGLFMKYDSESDLSREESYQLPSVEYLQYLISRTSFTGHKENLTDPEWEKIWKLTVETIKLTGQWIFSRPTLETPPTEIDELRYFLDNKKLGMRIDRYQLFLEEHWRESLIPYDRWIKELYGITAEELVSGLKNIHEHQKRGLLDRYRDLSVAETALMELLREKGYAVNSSGSEKEIERTKAILRAPEYNEKILELEEKAKLALTPAIFDITEIAKLPQIVIELLSVRPGEAALDKPLDMDDEDNLSPISNSLFQLKPLIKMNGRFYHFFHSGIEDRAVELIERDIFGHKPAEIQTLTAIRAHSLEIEASHLIDQILKPDNIYHNVYYPNPDNPGTLAELDTLVKVDDILLLIEAKAGRFQEAASRHFSKVLLNNLKNLIVEGQRQCERVERYIRSKEKATFLDKTHKNTVCEIISKDIREIFRIVVTREPLGWIGAMIARLSIIDKNFYKALPWHVAIDDLRAIADIFNTQGPQFVSYLETRLKASAHKEITQIDEIDHVALYLKMNQYYLYQQGEADRITFGGYSKDIDVYFVKKDSGEIRDSPKQLLPNKVELLVRALEESKIPGRYETISFILALDHIGRNDLDKHITALEDKAFTGRKMSIRFPLQPLKKGISVSMADDEDWGTEQARSAALMAVAKCTSWLLVKLDNIRPYHISRIERIRPGDIVEIEVLRAKDELDAQISLTARERKNGRNELCPCGSGIKYKRCHGK